ncbi:MAG: glutamine--fructose-6-phosphate transaminase (isomerizing) [Gammaproteobacteria bacterium AqS3]|nr:glutamine--fructose-6-phosphate transaminase (isomerizing) [Gammaproteobacteria bacterium AqS3]
MCGIVGAIAQRPVAGILMEGLHRLEYRGYDSAGIAVSRQRGKSLELVRRQGKLRELKKALGRSSPVWRGRSGIGHTRWATHGEPSERNAHPQAAGDIALVHNGIIENYRELRATLNVLMQSETDTEVVAHLLNARMQQGDTLLEAMRSVVPQLVGAYSLAAISAADPGAICVARSGSPLVIGIGIGEHFVASDVIALGQVTDRFIYLEEGDIAEIRRDSIDIYDAGGECVRRDPVTQLEHIDSVERGEFRHFMEKEIHEQPAAVNATLENAWDGSRFSIENAFGNEARRLLGRAKSITLTACGTSYHAAMIGKYWIESRCGVPCHAEIASELRNRRIAVAEDSLLVAISQSGETADTLEAVRTHRAAYMGVLGISNVSTSTLVRESDLVFLTRAGMEIGVASTKAFTTQLVGIMMLMLALGQTRSMDDERIAQTLAGLVQVPKLMRRILHQREQVADMASELMQSHGSLFLGRGTMYPLACEGALKLKELSYMHAEAYPAGELKHGPLALVDEDMPVIVIAPNNALLSKLESNMAEVSARGGRLLLICNRDIAGDRRHTVNIPEVDPLFAPLVFVLPLQLLAYEVALLKGTDIDQPRNLAKSVTVE